MCLTGYPVRVRQVPKAKPIVAYRWWRPHWRGWNVVQWNVVQSAYYGQVWVPPGQEMPRVRDVGRHTTTGYHAYQTLEQAEYANDGSILGRVFLWGTVVEYENGYRASHARRPRRWRI